MKIRGLVDEDFINYKKASMFLVFPYCDFKCDREFGTTCCQNSELVKQKLIDIDENEIVSRYLANPITNAIVFGGLEPLKSENEMFSLIEKLRKVTDDDIVIYTGYYKHEISEQLAKLRQFKNIIVKFGRFIPNSKSVFSEVLGITLASDNQYAERIS